MRPASLVVAGIVLIAACDAPRRPVPDSTTAPALDSVVFVNAIDSMIPRAVAGEGGWNYVESATADLMGDSLSERIVLTARVELYRGRPAWDDGQPWQVYVESSGGERTYLYAQRLQLGTLTMRLTPSDSARETSLLLIEHLPDRMRILGTQRRGATLGLVTVFERELDPRGQQASPRLR